MPHLPHHRSEALDGQKIVFLKDEVGRIVWSKVRSWSAIPTRFH